MRKATVQRLCWQGFYSDKPLVALTSMALGTSRE